MKNPSRTIWGEWQPDQPDHLNEGLTVADGCFPIKNGYAPVRSFSAAAAGTLTGRCYGAAAYRASSATYVFAATLSNVYRFTTTGFSSLIGGLNNVLRVRFCPYSNLMLATNGTDSIKKFDPTVATVMSNLGGSPPIARYIAVVGGFAVLGYVSNSPTRVAWSDQGNPENWTAGGASEAGVADMATGGDITGIVGGEYGLIFQENRIVRMSYTASDTIWQFDELATDIGCILPGSIATWGKLTFFLSNRGYMVCDGSSVTPIGDEKVDRWLLGRADVSYYDRATAVIDPANSLYLMAVPSAAPANTLLIYSYTLSRWTTASLPVEYMAQGYAQSYTLEDLSTLYGTLEAIPNSLDSPLYRGGTPLLLMFDDQHRLGSLGGMPLPATFTDAKREAYNGTQARLRTIRPLTDAAAPVVRIGGADALSAPLTSTTYTSRRANGVFPVRESWNLIQVSLQIPPQPWTYAQGYDVEVTAGGRA